MALDASNGQIQPQTESTSERRRLCSKESFATSQEMAISFGDQSLALVAGRHQGSSGRDVWESGE